MTRFSIVPSSTLSLRDSTLTGRLLVLHTKHNEKTFCSRLRYCDRKEIKKVRGRAMVQPQEVYARVFLFDHQFHLLLLLLLILLLLMLFVVVVVVVVGCCGCA